jgi:hypothetical protein
VTLNPDGSRTITVAGKNGTTRQQTQWSSFQSYTITDDENADRTVDKTTTVTNANNVTTTVVEQDTDLDGVPDWRQTGTVGTSGPPPFPLTMTAEEMLLPPDGGVRQYLPVAQSTTVSPRFAESTSCFRNLSLPPSDAGAGAPDCWFDDVPKTWSDTQGKSTPLFGSVLDPGGVLDHIRVLTTGKSACDVISHGIIQDAFNQALGEGLTRIGGINVGHAIDLVVALAEKDLIIGCEYPACLAAQGHAGGMAYHDGADLSDDPGADIIEIRPEIIQQGVDPTAEMVLHELFHYAGKEHDNGDEGGTNARDYIYACARYGNSCRGYPGFYLGYPGDASSARDAAMCADADNKGQFGVQAIAVQSDKLCGSETAPGPQTPHDVCSVADPAPPTTPCTCCVANVWDYCDQTLIPAASATSKELDEFQCCLACPTGFAWNPAVCPTGLVGVPKWQAPSKPPVTTCQPLAGCGY